MLMIRRGSPTFPPIHLRLDYRPLILHRRPHPTHTIYGKRNRRDRSHHLQLCHRLSIVHFWRIQDLFHVSLSWHCPGDEAGADGLSGATGGVGGYLYGATSTMFVGGLAAAAAFLLVKVLDVRE